MNRMPAPSQIKYAENQIRMFVLHTKEHKKSVSQNQMYVERRRLSRHKRHQDDEKHRATERLWSSHGACVVFGKGYKITAEYREKYKNNKKVLTNSVGLLG